MPGGRSYEERVSSYRKTFGPDGATGGAGRVQETREQVQYRLGELYGLKRNFQSSLKICILYCHKQILL